MGIAQGAGALLPPASSRCFQSGLLPLSAFTGLAPWNDGTLSSLLTLALGTVEAAGESVPSRAKQSPPTLTSSFQVADCRPCALWQFIPRRPQRHERVERGCCRVQEVGGAPGCMPVPCLLLLRLFFFWRVELQLLRRKAPDALHQSKAPVCLSPQPPLTCPCEGAGPICLALGLSRVCSLPATSNPVSRTL